MEMAHIMAAVVFGSIGLGVFIYGKKQSNLKSLVIGILLMGYPYLVANTLAVWGIGVVLVAALFILP